MCWPAGARAGRPRAGWTTSTYGRAGAGRRHRGLGGGQALGRAGHVQRPGPAARLAVHGTGPDSAKSTLHTPAAVAEPLQRAGGSRRAAGPRRCRAARAGPTSSSTARAGGSSARRSPAGRSRSPRRPRGRPRPSRRRSRRCRPRPPASRRRGPGRRASAPWPRWGGWVSGSMACAPRPAIRAAGLGRGNAAGDGGRPAQRVAGRIRAGPAGSARAGAACWTETI